MPVTKIQCATFLLVASAAIGCGEPYGPGPFALPPGKPINGVTVYAGSHFQFAEVGDTAHVRAYGYHDGQGIWAESVTSATWSPSDPTMLRIVRTVNRGNGSTATLIGERPGVVVLSVQLNGVTDADTIRVLPRIARLQLKATRTTVAVGDTVTVWLRADDLAGDSIPHLRPLIVPTGDAAATLRYIGPWPAHRYVGSDTGTARFYTIVNNDSTDLRLSIVRAP